MGIIDHDPTQQLSGRTAMGTQSALPGTWAQDVFLTFSNLTVCKDSLVYSELMIKGF